MHARWLPATSPVRLACRTEVARIAADRPDCARHPVVIGNLIHRIDANFETPYTRARSRCSQPFRRRCSSTGNREPGCRCQTGYRQPGQRGAGQPVLPPQRSAGLGAITPILRVGSHCASINRRGKAMASRKPTLPPCKPGYRPVVIIEIHLPGRGRPASR